MAETEVAYLERRAAAEEALARRAKSPAAVDAHHQMAKAYHESAAALKGTPLPVTQRYDA